jgi:hypothetical protein
MSKFKKNILLTLVATCHLLLYSNNTIAQATQKYKLIKTIANPIADFAVDNLGNVFLINKRQQVKKLNANYDSVGNYNDLRKYGKLYSIDASNPLRVVLFFKEFATIVLLDRFLNTRNIINLRKQNILQCSAVAQSYDNQLWVFDELEFKLKKIDENGKQLLETPDLRILLTNPQKPDHIEDYNKYLYLYDSAKGLSIFDYYGAFKNQIALTKLTDVHGYKNGIIARDTSGLVYYQTGAITTTPIYLPPHILKAKKVKIVGNKLFVLGQNELLEVYQIL